jgi:hypothetical protein
MEASPLLPEEKLRLAPQLVPNRYTSIIASGPLMDKVFRLRYRSYRADNYIEENSTARLMDKYDSQCHCISYLTYSYADLLGSIRCCVFSPALQLRVPAMEVFGEEIEKTIGLDAAFLEVNKFVVNPDFQNRGGMGAKFAIYRNVISAVDESKSSCVIVAVRPEHVQFYKLMFYERISETKPYPGVRFETVLMICRDLEPARRFIEKRIKDEWFCDDSIPNFGPNRLSHRYLCRQKKT